MIFMIFRWLDILTNNLKYIILFQSIYWIYSSPYNLTITFHGEMNKTSNFRKRKEKKKEQCNEKVVIWSRLLHIIDLSNHPGPLQARLLGRERLGRVLFPSKQIILVDFVFTLMFMATKGHPNYRFMARVNVVFSSSTYLP